MKEKGALAAERGRSPVNFQFAIFHNYSFGNFCSFLAVINVNSFGSGGKLGGIEGQGKWPPLSKYVRIYIGT